MVSNGLDAVRGRFSSREFESLQRVQEIRLSEASAHVGAETPFVVRNAEAVLAVCSMFTPSNLRRILDDRDIKLEHKHRWSRETKRAKLHEYLGNLEGSQFYWRQVRMSGIGLEARLLPRVANRADCAILDYLWVGPADTVQTFHQDNHNEIIVNSNLYMQMFGSKYAAVASHADSRIFQSQPLLEGYLRHSSLSPFDATVQQAATTLRHVVLQPGDILFIPPRAWHFFQSLTASVSVSRWWFESRIAEVLYGSGSDNNSGLMEAPVCASDWSRDLAEIGGQPALRSYLADLAWIHRYAAIVALMRRYGHDVVAADCS